MTTSTELNKQACLPGLTTSVVDSPDRKPRTGEPWVGIIVHHTGLPKQVPDSPSAWQKYHEAIVGWLSRKDDAYVSAHYQISRTGSITQLVNPDHFIAYHAGVSSWWHPIKRRWLENWNTYSIGVELLGDGNVTDYSPEQYRALAILVANLRHRYPTIQANMVLGHEHIAPGRKSDPGKLFNWNRLYSLVHEHTPIKPA